jgi:hypothetical protein
MTGSVSDDTAQGIGRMIGAQILFSGSINQYRDMYRMRVQAIVVETAEIIGTRTINIKYDPTLTSLLGRINPADQWKYQWLYAGINVGYTATFIEPDFKDPSSHFYDAYYFFDIPFGYGIYLMAQPFDLFGIALDFGGTMYEGPTISILPTLTLRPSIFEIDLFFGVGAIIPPSSFGDFAILGGIRGGQDVQILGSPLLPHLRSIPPEPLLLFQSPPFHRLKIVFPDDDGGQGNAQHIRQSVPQIPPFLLGVLYPGRPSFMWTMSASLIPIVTSSG